MKVLLEESKAEIVIKNSRFISEVFPVETQAQAREKLHEVKQKYFDATHVVHAFSVGLKSETFGMFLHTDIASLEISHQIQSL